MRINPANLYAVSTAFCRGVQNTSPSTVCLNDENGEVIL